MVFTGSVKLKVLEVTDLKSRKHGTLADPGRVTSIEPCVTVHVDNVLIAQTTSKPKTSTPVWNEEFESYIENGETLEITVYHNAFVRPEAFVLKSSVPLEEIIASGTTDLWV